MLFLSFLRLSFSQLFPLDDASLEYMHSTFGLDWNFEWVFAKIIEFLKLIENFKEILILEFTAKSVLFEFFSPFSIRTAKSTNRTNERSLWILFKLYLSKLRSLQWASFSLYLLRAVLKWLLVWIIIKVERHTSRFQLYYLSDLIICRFSSKVFDNSNFFPDFLVYLVRLL